MPDRRKQPGPRGRGTPEGPPAAARGLLVAQGAAPGTLPRMSGLVIGIVTVVVIAAIVIFAVVQYNKLKRLNINVDEAFAQIEVQLRRRADLVPNLIGAVKGYAAHEQAVLQRVTEARTSTMQASTQTDVQAADGALTQALRGLFAVAESYPDLKASANFLHLQEELATTENKVAFARQYFNDTVNTLNTACATIPSSLFTGVANVGPRDFYEIDDPTLRDVPKVEF